METINAIKANWITVYRPGIPVDNFSVSYNYPGVTFDVVANGTLIIKVDGNAIAAFSPDQWLTVGHPPIGSD